MSRYWMSAVLLAAAISYTGYWRAEEPHPPETALFVSGADGYHTYRIPSLIVTKAGTVLAFCEGRKQSLADSGDIDLLVKRSDDGGSTWSGQQIVWDDGPNTCGNPCPVIDRRNGRIVLLSTWNRGDDHGHDLHRGAGKDTRRVFVLTSDDDGRTWSKPRQITAEVKEEDWWWYATGPGVGIQLRQEPHAGRLVIPSDHTSAKDNMSSHVIYSDDGGETWRRSTPIGPGCNESQVVELADGTLLMNMRTQSFTGRERTGYRAISFSRDGGETWSAPVPDKHLGDPQVQASLIRYSLASGGTRNRLLFCNPSPPIRRKPGKRVNLTVRLSYDEGKTWPVARVIHAGPSAYSCLTRLPDGEIGLLYEGGDKNAYENLLYTHFSLDWLTRGAGSR